MPSDPDSSGLLAELKRRRVIRVVEPIRDHPAFRELLRPRG